MTTTPPSTLSHHHPRRSLTALFVPLLLLAAPACGGSDDAQVDAAPSSACRAMGDSAADDWCGCSATGDDEVAECSEASVNGLCCDADVLCTCMGMACGRDTSGLCYCGAREIAIDEQSVEVASCAPAAVDERCCLGEGGPNGASCSCGSMECLPSEHEVASCDVAATRDCGYATRVSDCR